MTNWKGKHFLEDIMEGQKLTVDKIVSLSGLDKQWIINYLDDSSELMIDEARDALLCQATNQVPKYFYNLDLKYLENKEAEND